MTNSPIPRVGGKRLLRNKICDLFPDGKKFNRYIEVFGGGGWVLFAKDKHANLEVYNDADGELVNLMRCIKYHCGELQREINGYFNSREIFYFENLIKVYDRPSALFYCDPPYHTTEKYYDVPFSEADHFRLKQCLNDLKGLFLLSYNDDEFIRKLYKDYNIKSVDRPNNMSNGTYKELIITNY